MSTSKLYIAIGLIIAFGLFTEIAAHADDRFPRPDIAELTIELATK